MSKTATVPVKRILTISLLAFLLGLTVLNNNLYSAGSGKKPKLDVPYEPTSYEIAEEMIRLADVRANDLVYDLGCGDGRIVIMAVKEKWAQGVGVDIDPERIKESKENAKKAGVADHIRFLQQDLFKTDIKDATVVMLYLWPEVNLRLRPKLLAELKPGTRIVSHSHRMGEWKPDRFREVSNHTLNFWVIPANVSGAWTWPVPGDKGGTGDSATLRIQQKYQEIKGTITMGNSTVPIDYESLRGNSISFDAVLEMEGQKIKMTFEGRAQGDEIQGTMTVSGSTSKIVPWNAKRDHATKGKID